MVLCRFELVLYLDIAAISNQIKYYLTTNRGSFLEMQCGFYRYALLADLIWFVVETGFTKNSRKAGTRLFGESLWKIITFLWLVKYFSKFVFIDRRSWNSEWPGQNCAMHWYFSRLASYTKYFDLLIKMSWKSNIS